MCNTNEKELVVSDHCFNVTRCKAVYNLWAAVEPLTLPVTAAATSDHLRHCRLPLGNAIVAAITATAFQLFVKED